MRILLTLLVLHSFGIYSQSFSDFINDSLAKDSSWTARISMNLLYGSIDKVDSLYQKKDQLKDGKYLTFWDNKSEIRQFEFYVKDGSIHGLFKYYNQYGIINVIGTYETDSLWTFKSDTFLYGDARFKIGSWRWYLMPNPNDSSHNSSFIKIAEYRIPYSDSEYKELWTYKNRTPWIERYFREGVGLIKEVHYSKNGNKSSIETRVKKGTEMSTETLYFDREGNKKEKNK